MPTIALLSAKGGVGKTTAAVHLAAAAAAAGQRTLLVDLDPQGAASHLLRVRPACEIGAKAFWKGRHANTESGESGLVRAADLPRLEVLPAIAALRQSEVALDEMSGRRHRLATLLDRLGERNPEGPWDVVIIDCPPGLGILSDNVLRGADTILVPVPPSVLALRTVALLADLAGDRAATLRPFLTMARSNQAGMAKDLKEAWPRALVTIIPASAEIERAAQARLPVTTTAPRSAVARAFHRLWDEVVQDGQARS